MRQASLKIKSYAYNINSNIHIVDNDNLEKRVLYFLLGSIGALGMAYVFILGSMTFNIVERKALESEARTLANEVLELELAYMDKSASVDLNMAQSLGFREIKANFATRKSLGSLDRVKMAKNDL